MTDAPLPTVPDERPQRRREYSGPASTLGLAALIILVVGLAVWAVQFRGGGQGGQAGSAGFGVVAQPPGPNPTGRAPAAEQGRLAPNFRLATPDGGAVSLADYRGSFVLLNFWASWCGPCRSEAPGLQALADRTGGRGLVVLGVDQQESVPDVKAFAAEFDISYPLALDRDGGVSQAYRVGRGLPVSFLVSPQGVILKVYLGQLSADDLAAIEKEYTSS